MFKRHALHHQLGHALGRPHDVGWVHGFVGGDQNKLLCPALARNTRRMQGAQNIGTNRLYLIV